MNQWHSSEPLPWWGNACRKLHSSCPATSPEDNCVPLRVPLTQTNIKHIYKTSIQEFHCTFSRIHLLSIVIKCHICRNWRCEELMRLSHSEWALSQSEQSGLLMLTANFPAQNFNYVVPTCLNIFIPYLYCINNNSKTTEAMLCHLQQCH